MNSYYLSYRFPLNYNTINYVSIIRVRIERLNQKLVNKLLELISLFTVSVPIGNIVTFNYI